MENLHIVSDKFGKGNWIFDIWEVKFSVNLQCHPNQMSVL